MSDEAAQVPQAVVSTRRRISSVWIIPIAAAVIGAWLTYKSISDKGPQVTITFRTAEGLEAGKTMIKYRDFDVGVVESIDLAGDFSHVVVTARLQKGTDRYLTDRTRFWVVRARITAAGVSGMGTLLSGAYIGIDPVAEGPPRHAFEGLETPPLVTSREAGRLFALRTPTQGSLAVGVPIYFRQVPVGEVIRTELDPSGSFISVDIFVRSPHDEKVRENTKFWNTSGFNATVNETGLHIETESFVAMLIGGIAFDTTAGDASPRAAEGAVFPLYPDKRATVAEVYLVKQRFLMHFDGSVRGLAAGAPVEFRGIKIGQVADVRLVYDSAREILNIPVIIEIEPERIGIAGEDTLNVTERLARLVDRGLRAQLKTGNLLTGQLVVDLDFRPGASPAEVRYGGVHPELPTMPTQLEALTTNVTQFVAKLDRLPLDRIGAETAAALGALSGTLQETQALTRSVNGELVPALARTVDETQRTLQAAQTTLRGAERMMGPDSVVNLELKRLLAELTEAARSMRLLADHLERHPEDVLRGRSSP